MPAQSSPEESQPSTLSAESITLIQKVMEDLLGKCDQDPSGSSISTLDFGFSLLTKVIESCVRPEEIVSEALDALSWGDGDVDLLQLSAEITKRRVLDVLAQSRTALDNR